MAPLLRGFTLIVALLAAIETAAVAGEQPSQPATDGLVSRPSKEELKAGLLGANDKDWRAAFAQGERLAEAGDVGFEVVKENWSSLKDATKQQLMKAWTLTTPYPLHARMHPRLLDTLDLGVADAAVEVRTYATDLLKQVALEDFAGDAARYRAWRERGAGRPLATVMAEGAAAWVARLKVDDVRSAALAVAGEVALAIRDVPSVKEAVVKAGLVELVKSWSEPGAGGVEAKAAVSLARPLGLTKPSQGAKVAPDDGNADIAEVPSENVLIGGDANKRYMLITRAREKEPENGYHLLVVLPGGGGGADFNPFVRRILKNALPRGFVVAQAVAPVWREDKDRIVWPTAKLPDEKMAFATEQFVKDVIADVKAKRKIDDKRVYLLAWSSSGPAAYTSLVSADVPIAGAFIAMSVFKSAEMPALGGAKGRRVYVLHSPQDFIKIDFPRAAVKQLGAAGAAVHMEEYEGGHGWHGDVFGMVRKGVEWLETTEK